MATSSLYAISGDVRTQTLVVGPQRALARTVVRARGRLFVPVERAQVKLRHRAPTVPAAVESTARGFRLALETAAHGVAAGQAAVLYEDDVVVGAGVITSASRA